ncbi:MAG TPA: zinc metalloprotease HtpX, partial [Solirubrobacteraceae bacterium]|nr:zinc metalloprotease HtpX [Solirubrobacteraceae bacterium]
MASRRSNFGRDTALQARMLFTMFLLGLLYVVFVGVLFVAGAGAGLIVVVAGALLLIQLFT